MEWAFLWVVGGWWAGGIMERLAAVTLQRVAPDPSLRPLSIRFLFPLGCAVGFTVICFVHTDTEERVIGCFLFLFLSAALLTDLWCRLIPDRLTIPAFFLFFLLRLVDGKAASSLIGAFLCGGVLVLAAYLSGGGMGGGDVKLATAAGAALGWPVAVVGLALAIMLGGVVSTVLLLVGKVGRKTALPFAPFLLAGFLSAFLWGQMLADWYLSLLG
ncbi:prepilin peptidase [Salinithrix halophila]|uniref:Prepilin peptidase n=1 Tax=Salinithrix halophila TaxID=1485204 RepID=A0ABV8JQY7_9BACL